MTSKTRSRFLYAILLGLTIAAGLLTRSAWVPGDSFLGEYAGDALWTVAVYWSVAFLLPRWVVWKLVLVSLGISYAVELSQLYHAPWIDQIRAMKLGALLLGSTFYWPDLLCYSVGAGAAGLLDYFWLRKEHQSPWQWWLTSTMKDKFICWGILGLVFCAVTISMNFVFLKILGASCAFLVIGLMLRSEDSTDI